MHLVLSWSPKLWFFRCILLVSVVITFTVLFFNQFWNFGHPITLHSSTKIAHPSIVGPRIIDQGLLDQLPDCSLSSSPRVGPLNVDLELHSWDYIRAKYVNANYSFLRNQTSWFDHAALALWLPTDCRSDQKIALILPFRDRDEHLRIFLHHMHGFLRHQRAMYTIFVIEQVGDTLFNRAALFNVGFREAIQLDDYDCFIFHDVDLLPQDDRLPYRCQDRPIHLSVAIDKFNYILPYASLFGGAVALSRAQIERIRGFSNCFFGWGGEDDDLSFRVSRHYAIFRHSTVVSRYIMLKHGSDKSNHPNPARNNLLSESGKRLHNDGYPETKYTVVSTGPVHDALYYGLSVDIHPNQSSPHVNQFC